MSIEKSELADGPGDGESAEIPAVEPASMSNEDGFTPSRRTVLAGIAGAVTIPSGVVVGSDQSEEGITQSAWKPTAHDITANDGLRLRIWERTFVDDPAEAVLFVHGATYGAVSMFDPPVTEALDSVATYDPPATRGFGWMPYAAERGQATFALDIRGYGESELPPEYKESPDQNNPVLSRSFSAGLVNDAANFVREEQGFDRIHIVGLSDGQRRIRALYNEYDPDFETVTLCGASFPEPADYGSNPEEPAYGTETYNQFIQRWNDQIPEGADINQWIGGEAFTAEEVQAAVWRAIYETNQAIDDDPETILTPSRMLKKEHHPKAITDPTIVIRGELDPLVSREAALQLYDAVGADEDRKQFTEIAGGTHFIWMENKREQLFQTTFDFQSMY